MTRAGAVLVTSCILLGCGPSEEERKACTDKKTAARDAWGTYAKALKTESVSVRAELTRLSQEAERQAVLEGAGGPPDPAQAAALRAKAAPRIAHADARRAYSAVVETAASAAETIQNAWGGSSMHAVEVEAGEASHLEGVTAAAARVSDTTRGLASGDSPGTAPSGALAGLKTTAQTASTAAMEACAKIEVK